MTQTSLLDAIELKEEGMKRAIQHAEIIEPNWQEMALRFLETFAHNHLVFTGEDVRNASSGIVPEPPCLRSWGSVIRTAANRGWIEQIGTVKVRNARAHCANAARWYSRIAWKS